MLSVDLCSTYITKADSSFKVIEVRLLLSVSIRNQCIANHIIGIRAVSKVILFDLLDN